MTDQTGLTLSKEESIRTRMLEMFPGLQDRITIQRPRRIFVKPEAGNFDEILHFAIHSLGFIILCTITGLDNTATLGFIYHMARTDGITLNIQIDVPKENPVIKTVTRYFPCAEIYEREVIDLLGAKVDGLSEGIRYPLPDGWPAGQYPLRKDWAGSINKEVKDA